MRAYLQLVRLPNVFTAMADILLGYLFTHARLEPWQPLALLLAASCLLYMAGMVLNDFFDRAQDAVERPERPIPSGRVSPAAALALGLAMPAAGVGLGWGATYVSGDVRAGITASLLAVAVFVYDGVLKRTPAAPVAMGACRMLNVLLGMSTASEPWQAIHVIVACGVGLYVCGITIFARSEARTSPRGQLVFGVVVLLAGIGLLASLPGWPGPVAGPELRVPGNWYLFWTLMAVWIAGRCGRAIVDPRPAIVQGAVRGCIFSLVVLDAGASLAVSDFFGGLVILSLLAPMMIVGRWIYST